LLHYPFGEVRIGYDSKTNSYGRSDASTAEYCAEVWKKIGYHSPLSPREAKAIVAMSGAASELQFLGELCDGHWGDQEKIDKLGFDDNEVSKLWRMTRQLVHDHAGTIERVAVALAAEGRLSAVEIDRLVCGMAPARRLGGPWVRPETWTAGRRP
jgi:hypothetical protein